MCYILWTALCIMYYVTSVFSLISGGFILLLLLFAIWKH